MRVLGLVPARGGSKGIPRKNLVLLAGRPLLAYTVEAAKASRSLVKVILSTEDEEIALVGARLGLEVPFIRPVALAQDDTPMLPVVKHALTEMERRGEVYDAVCLLQPSHPLRKPEWIDACVTMLAKKQCDAVATIARVPTEFNPYWVFFHEPERGLISAMGNQEVPTRRQLLPPAFIREGSVYVTRRDVVLLKNSLYGDCFYGLEVNLSDSINIDEPEDLLKAEMLIKKIKKKLNVF